MREPHSRPGPLLLFHGDALMARSFSFFFTLLLLLTTNKRRGGPLTTKQQKFTHKRKIQHHHGQRRRHQPPTRPTPGPFARFSSSLLAFMTRWCGKTKPSWKTELGCAAVAVTNLFFFWCVVPPLDFGVKQLTGKFKKPGANFSAFGKVNEPCRSVKF